MTDIPYDQDGYSILITPAEVLIPPHVWWIEFTGPTQVTEIHSERRLSELHWEQVSPKEIELRFSGPALAPLLPLRISLFTIRQDFQVKTLKRLLGSGSQQRLETMAILNFGSVLDGNCSERKFALEGARAGDLIRQGWPPNLPAGVMPSMLVSEDNKVSARICNIGMAKTITYDFVPVRAMIER